jgi:hypothetical protein
LESYEGSSSESAAVERCSALADAASAAAEWKEKCGRRFRWSRYFGGGGGRWGRYLERRKMQQQHQ